MNCTNCSDLCDWKNGGIEKCKDCNTVYCGYCWWAVRTCAFKLSIVNLSESCCKKYSYDEIKAYDKKQRAKN